MTMGVWKRATFRVALEFESTESLLRESRGLRDTGLKMKDLEEMWEFTRI